MPYSIRPIPAARKFCEALPPAVLARAIPQATVEAALADPEAQARRECRLSMPVAVWALVAMHLDPHLALPPALRQVARGLRHVWPDPDGPFREAVRLM